MLLSLFSRHLFSTTRLRSAKFANLLTGLLGLLRPSARRVLSWICALGFSFNASAALAFPAEMLGLSIGGSVPGDIQRCTDSTYRAGLCWAGSLPRPGRYNVSPISFLDVPTAPEWVRIHTSDLYISDKGLINMLRVKLIDEKYMHQASQTITSRFGAPHKKEGSTSGTTRLVWQASGLQVTLECALRLCTAQFESPQNLVQQSKATAAPAPTRPAGPL